MFILRRYCSRFQIVFFFSTVNVKENATFLAIPEFTNINVYVFHYFLLGRSIHSGYKMVAVICSIEISKVRLTIRVTVITISESRLNTSSVRHESLLSTDSRTF